MALRLALFLAFPVCCLAQTTGACTIEVVAGRGNAPPLPAVAVRFASQNPAPVRTDRSGHLFLSPNRYQVLRLDGKLLQFAAGEPNVSPYFSPQNPVFSYLTDFLTDDGQTFTVIDNSRIRQWLPDGSVQDIAGGITSGYKGDGGPATNSLLRGPTAIVRAFDGSLLIADSGNFRIRRIDPKGNIDTVAGSGGGDPTIGEGGDATFARIGPVSSLAAAADGSFYFVESSYPRLRVVDSKNTIHTLVTFGTGAPADPPVVPLSSANLGSDALVASGADGQIYLADSKTVRILKSDGNLYTVFTNSGPTYSLWNFAAGPDGTAYLSTNRGVLQIAPGSSTAVLVVGNDTTVSLDGVPAVNADISPSGLALDAGGLLYFASLLTVYRIQPDGTLAQVVTFPLGTQPAAIRSMTFDRQGRLLVVLNGQLQRVNADGSTAILANGTAFGNGRMAVSDDGTLYALDATATNLYAIADDGSLITLWSKPTGTSAFSVYPDAPLLRRPDGTFWIANNAALLQLAPDGTLAPVFQNTMSQYFQSGILDMAAESATGDLVLLDVNALSFRDAASGDVFRYGYLSNGRDWGQANYGTAAAGVVVPDGQGNVYVINRPAAQIERVRNYRQCLDAPRPESVGTSAFAGLPGTVAPGTSVTLNGVNLGPPQGATAVADSSGRLPFSLGNMTVTVGDRPAPILSAQSQSLTFQIPYGLDVAAIQASQGLNVNVPDLPVTLSYKGNAAPPLGTNLQATYPVVQPAAFTTSPTYFGLPYAFARNADGSINSQTNPAPYNSTVAIYINGIGELSPRRANGDAPAIPLRPAEATVAILTNFSGYYIEQPIVYMSESPDEVGFYQVNFLAQAPGPFQLAVGSIRVIFTVWLK